MDQGLKDALKTKLLAMADDELVLGHRDSEWTGHAPILEEDIAFANIALDEIGHARLWYELLADLEGADRASYPDHLSFFRDARDFRNLRMAELPKGDWAFTILRQYLLDLKEVLTLDQMVGSAYAPLAQVAAKIRPEEHYHLRHSRAWLRRLALGTEESHGRMQAALAQLWPFTAQFFAPLPGEAALVEAGYLPEPSALREAWLEAVQQDLEACGLDAPPSLVSSHAGREQHSEHLQDMLLEMQSVARLDPLATW